VARAASGAARRGRCTAAQGRSEGSPVGRTSQLPASQPVRVVRSRAVCCMPHAVS
jgi:hypothetical protein